MSEAATESKVYTPEEICEAYKIGRTTLWRLTRTGKVPRPFRIGQLRRYPAAETDAAFERMRGQAV